MAHPQQDSPVKVGAPRHERAGSRIGDVVRPLYGAVLIGWVLAGCGGGGSSSAESSAVESGSPSGSAALSGASSSTTSSAGQVTTVKAGPGCSLEYTLTGRVERTGLDPLLAQQWHLQNTGQVGGGVGQDIRVVAAWNRGALWVARGAGVRVAVIDESVELTHPDLWPNVVAERSYSYRPGNVGSIWPVPCQLDSDHGTAVAGLLAARNDNAVGGVGVAPRAELVAYDALASGVDADIIDALSRDRQVNHIYQNSWGSLDDGALHLAGPAMAQVLEAGVQTGRGGKGSIFVFSGGNGGLAQDDVNYDGYVNHRAIVAVCAVDNTGRNPPYSEPGAVLTVCAPSSGGGAGLTTAGLKGAMRADFGGTSGAAPIVSGVVALMLAANPNLSWRDVRLILAGTARQNDPTDPSWRTANGYHFSHKYGFGVVDADAAVVAAAAWTSVGGSQTQLRCGPYVKSPALGVPDAVAIGAGSAITDTVVVADCPINQIEWVEVALTAPHESAGDLRVRLRSPNGIDSYLADARACSGDCGSYQNWRLGSMAHLGERAIGSWALELTDERPSVTGQFEQWSITFYGR